MTQFSNVGFISPIYYLRHNQGSLRKNVLIVNQGNRYQKQCSFHHTMLPPVSMAQMSPAQNADSVQVLESHRGP